MSVDIDEEGFFTVYQTHRSQTIRVEEGGVSSPEKDRTYKADMVFALFLMTNPTREDVEHLMAECIANLSLRDNEEEVP